MLSSLIAFITSDTGLKLIGIVGTAVWGLFKAKAIVTDKQVERYNQLKNLALTIYDGVESRSNPTDKGSDKWKMFVDKLMDTMRGNGMGELTGPEMQKIRALIDLTAFGDSVRKAK